MGQTLSSETLSISGGDGYRYWVGLIMKPSEVGCKKTVYKGVLLGHGPRQWEKVVAKAFTEIPGTKESWKYELNKADVTKQLAAKFVQDYPSLCAIRIVTPGIVQMDRVSNLNKRLAGKDDGRGLTKDEWISVEELIPGQMGRFCPWSMKHIKDLVESEHMQAFSHFTYTITNGELVACDFQGTFKPENFHYIFTDSSIHSRFKLYGLFDQGDFGISEFFKLHKCNDICKDWPKPTPLTPPPSFELASMLQNSLTPASAFENIVFPAYNCENAATHGNEQNAGNVQIGDRRRHASEHNRLLQQRGQGLRIGQSLDIPDHTRRSSFSLERSTIRENNYQPPAYENVMKSNLPPHYDSLAHPNDNNSNGNIEMNPESQTQSTSRNQVQKLNGKEAINKLKFRHRSATDPQLQLRYTPGSNVSGACVQGSNGSVFCSKCKPGTSSSCGESMSTPVLPSAPAFCCNEDTPPAPFCCGNDAPSSAVPSAPPEERDISGT